MKKLLKGMAKGKQIFIGTFHGELTDRKELTEIMQEIKPDVLAVEIAQEDIDDKNIKKYPSEMVFTYNWALEKNILIFDFDSKIDIFLKKDFETDNEALIEKQKKIMEKYSWKDINRQAVVDEVSALRSNNLVDEDKSKKREKELINNLKNIFQKYKDKKVLVLAGGGHLETSEKAFSGALFPLRK